MPPTNSSVKKLTRVIVEWSNAEWSPNGTDPSVKRQKQQALLALLEGDPTLARVLIGSETSYDDCSYYSLECSSAYALTYMIDFGCDLNAIQKVYNIFPEAVRDEQIMGLESAAHPVYFACKKKNIQKDVVIFLAKAFPDAIRRHVPQVLDRRKRVALFEALRPDGNGQLAPFEVIETLVDLYPKSGSDRVEGKLLLEELIQHGHVDSKSLEFAVSKLSKGVDTLTVSGDTCCTRPAIRVMQRVLQAVQPQLKELSLVPNYSSPDGFVRLLKAVLTTADSNNESLLEKLELAIPTAASYHHGTLRNLLRAILSSLPNLQHVSLAPAKLLSVRRADQDFCSDAVLEDVASNLQTRFQATTPVVPLKSLQLSKVQVSDICNFATFLAFRCLAPHVALYQFTLDQQEWGKTTALFPLTEVTPSSSSIEHLELVQCHFASADCLCQMLCDLAKFLPFLKTLSIKDPSVGLGNSVEGGTEVDITKPLVALVAKKQLQDLRLVYEKNCCFAADMSAVCRALVQNDNNETLQTLHLTVDLKDDQQGRDHLLKAVQSNTSLHEVVVYNKIHCFTKKGYSVPSGGFRFVLIAFDDEHVSAIEYYLNLNRFGRAQVRGCNISKEHFLCLLDAANQNLDAGSMALFNVTYGLLREASNIWSGTSPRTIPDESTRRVRRRLM